MLYNTPKSMRYHPSHQYLPFKTPGLGNAAKLTNIYLPIKNLKPDFEVNMKIDSYPDKPAILDGKQVITYNKDLAKQFVAETMEGKGLQGPPQPVKVSKAKFNELVTKFERHDEPSTSVKSEPDQDSSHDSDDSKDIVDNNYFLNVEKDKKKKKKKKKDTAKQTIPGSGHAKTKKNKKNT